MEGGGAGVERRVTCRQVVLLAPMLMVWPPRRTMRLRPLAAGWPPQIPKGCMDRRSLRMLAVMGRRNSSCTARTASGGG